MELQFASAIVGALGGMVSTGLLAAVTTGSRLARMDTRLANVEDRLNQISYVRVKHRANDDN